MRKCFLLFISVLALCIPAGFAVAAQTRTVGATGDYADLAAAVADLGTWGDGDDTIEIESGTYVHSAQIAIGAKNGGSLTITPENPGPSAVVIAMGAAGHHIFECGRNVAGTVIYDGLTIIGPNGTATGAGRVCFELRDPGVGITGTTVVRNCVITSNAGGNSPKTNWGSDSAQPTNGNIGFPMTSADGLAGTLIATFENCTIAYPQVDGAIAVFGIATTGNLQLTFDHCLLVNGQEKLFRLRDIVSPSSVTIVDCAMFNIPATAITWSRNDRPAKSLTGALTVEDSIIEVKGGGMIQAFDLANTTLTVNRTTLNRYPTADDGVLVFDPGVGVNVVMNDIVTSGQDSVLRVRPDGETVASLTINNIAAHAMDAVRANQHADLLAAFAALYGGTGALADDPMWVSGDGSGYAVLDGMVGWNRGANTLYDVDNPAYADKGTPPHRAGALTGGADPTGSVPVELGTFSID